MDPQAAWDQLLAAYADGDWDVIEERATDLLAWLDRGGFPPKVLTNRDLGDDINRAIARAGCLLALDMVRGHWGIPDPNQKETSDAG